MSFESQTPAQTLQERFLAAVAQHQAGKVKDALAVYEDLIDLQRFVSADAFNLRAVALWQLGRAREASPWIQRAVSAQPDQLTFQQHAGFIARDLDDFAAATAHFSKALELDSSSPGAYLNLSGSLREARLHEQAIRVAEEGLKKFPDDTLLWNVLGNAFSDLGRRAESSDAYLRATQKDPYHFNAWSNYANSRAFQKGSLEDQALLDRLLTIEQEAPVTGEKGKRHLHYAIARIYQQWEMPKEAMDWLARANGAIPKDFPWEAYEDYLQRVRTIFDQDFFHRLKAEQPQDTDGFRPVFIIGMLRSGTSLLERMLGMHPQLQGIGERPAIGADRGLPRVLPVR